MRNRALIWAVLAVLGLAVATGFTFAAARVAGSHIALSPAPSGGVQLALPPAPRTVPSTTPTTVPTTPPQGGDDGGRGDD